MYTCNSNVIVTIGRQFGSGGREIGRKVAEELDIPFYDKELLEVEAREGKISIENLRLHDEKKTSVFMYSMAFNPYIGDVTVPLDMLIQDIQIKAVKTVANQGSCVIIGRRADKILRDAYNFLSVFVSAPIEKRIARVSERDGLSEKESHKAILKADKIRRSFYNAHGEGEWGDAANYNLCIDSGDLGVDHSVAMIIQYLKLKGKIV